MKFIFEYSTDQDKVELNVSDALIGRAQAVGYDLVSVETIARSLVSQFYYRVTGTDFWHRSPVLNTDDNDRTE